MAYEIEAIVKSVNLDVLKSDVSVRFVGTEGYVVKRKENGQDKVFNLFWEKASLKDVQAHDAEKLFSVQLPGQQTGTQSQSQIIDITRISQTLQQLCHSRQKAKFVVEFKQAQELVINSIEIL